MNTHLVWLRSDLRVIDNPALFKACEDPQAKVLAVFVATPLQWQHHHISARQATFIYDNLILLQQSLAELGIPLLYQECATFTDSIDVIVNICQTQKVNKLFYNYQYQWNEQQRDRLLEQKIKHSVKCIGYHGGSLLPPMSVLNGSGTMYKVYTPFRQACLKQLLQTENVVFPKPAARAPAIPYRKIAYFNYPQQDDFNIIAGEDAALERLKHFCLQDVFDYRDSRDIPALDKTSKLSAYLAIGVISVRQCYQRLLLEQPQFWQNQQSGMFSWFNELIWREFYQHLLVAYPKLSKNSPFINWTDNIVWNTSQADFLQWQQGLTGYPIIDAAMHQLNQTGWMHNRLRMIVASFLVKDLLIDWRWGERYFMSQLIDGDLAANNGGWQWAASTGTDSAPYFRIFNPTTQGQRFDPHGVFIRKWLPELAQVPDKILHTPHIWAEEQGITLSYPKPMIDHQIARRTTLAVFAAAKAMTS